MHRSFAHSAGAAVIILAAALTSTAPVAAHTAPPPDRDEGQSSSCYMSRKQSQGLDDIVWSALFGPQNTPTETGCDGGTAKGEQKGANGVLRPFTGS
jgi:hypothetical protein